MEKANTSQSHKKNIIENFVYFADYSCHLKFHPWFAAIISYDYKSPVGKFALSEFSLEVVLSESSALGFGLKKSEKESGKYALATLYKLKPEDLNKIILEESKIELEKLKSRDYEVVKTFNVAVSAEFSSEPGELKFVDVYDKMPVVAWFGRAHKPQNKIPVAEQKDGWNLLLKEYQKTFSIPENMATFYFYKNLNAEEDSAEWFRYFQGVFSNDKPQPKNNLNLAENFLELKSFKGENLLEVPAFDKEKEDVDWNSTFKILLEKSSLKKNPEKSEENPKETVENSQSEAGEKSSDAVIIEEIKN